MKIRNILLISLLMLALAVRAQVSFQYSEKPVMEITPDKNTGLNKIYVLYDGGGVQMKYTAKSTLTPVTWYKYEELGGGYAEEVTDVVRNGAETYVPQVETECGYIIEEGTDRTYIWVVDYGQHVLRLNSIETEPASDCGTVTLHVNGGGEDIVYYTITGVRKTLSRDITIDFNTLTWDESKLEWIQTPTTETEENFKSTIVLPAPYCNTTFTISGDRFLKFWHEGQTKESDTYDTNAVDIRAYARQETREIDNEKTEETGEILGGSAPANIIFEAYCSDAVVHKEWQMATDPNFNDIVLRLSGELTDQTFEEAGTTYWRFIGSNGDGSCEAISDTYTVNIGESELLCPNVFSPGVTEGVNDVWKVSYKSIIEFKCVIFNKWGNKIIELNDPSQGWDGTYKGKLVKPGVYYYVLEARGSDGKVYKKGGDINIIRYKQQLDTSTGNTDGIETEE